MYYSSIQNRTEYLICKTFKISIRENQNIHKGKSKAPTKGEQTPRRGQQKTQHTNNKKEKKISGDASKEER